MARTKQVTMPRIEVITADAYRLYSSLLNVRAALIAAGVAPDAAPSDDALRAFVLLGDFERNDIILIIQPHLAALQEAGLMQANLRDIPTAELRLFASVVDHIAALLTVSERFAAGIELASADSAINAPKIACATSVSGLWGQHAHVQFAVTDAAWILIRPEPIFLVNEALLRCDQRQTSGYFEIPVENGGSVLLAAMSLHGEVSTHLIDFSTTRDIHHE